MAGAAKNAENTNKNTNKRDLVMIHQDPKSPAHRENDSQSSHETPL